MSAEKWNYLEKGDGEGFVLRASDSHGEVNSRINIVQIAFDSEETWLIAVDTKGIAYCVDLSRKRPNYKKIGFVGLASLIAFNHRDNREIVVGLNSGEIKFLRLDKTNNRYCQLEGHSLPAKHVSFYEDHCITASSLEAIIWNMSSCSKLHQLKLNVKNMSLKKVAFSNLGAIVALYRNDIIQSWSFEDFDGDEKFDLKDFGLRDAKDFVFTRNGRAMIVAGFHSSMLAFNTKNWQLIRKIELQKDFGVKQLLFVPGPMDGGAHNILAVLRSNSTLQFLDVTDSNLLESTFKDDMPIQKISISQGGRFLAFLDKDGALTLTPAERLFVVKSKISPKQTKKQSKKVIGHGAEEHLECVKRDLREELSSERLLPILKEFACYPERYRALIWTNILQLPSNRIAFSALVEKNSQSSKTTFSNVALADHAKQKSLTTMLSCLINWYPLLEQCEFLPDFIFPFVTVFQKNHLSAFEAVLGILLNFSQKWFEYHPLPPLNVLGIIENALLETDPMLLKVLCERGITSTQYAWPLLQTTMSEILCGDEWLALWDFIITFQKPSLLLLCVVAYNIYVRETVISSVKNSREAKIFYSTQSNVRAKDLLRIAQKLYKELPRHIHPGCYLHDDIKFLPAEGSYPQFLRTEYPQFVVEGDQFDRLQKVSQEEANLKENYKGAIIAANESRLRQEREALLREIHNKRIAEGQKCWELKLRHKESQVESMQSEMSKETLRKTQWSRTPSTVTSNSKSQTCCCCNQKVKKSANNNTKSKCNNSTNSKSRNSTNRRDKLRKDVDKLEREVQGFIESKRSDHRFC